MRNLRDRILFDLENILNGEWSAPDLKELQKRISKFSDQDKETLRNLVDCVITSGMHDLLFALQEESDNDGSVRVMVDGQDVAKLSDGLHGEIFGDDGWIVRYSQYPAERQMELSKWAAEEIKNLLDKKEDQSG